MVKLAKAASKQANQKKKAPPPPKEVDEESSEEDSEEEDTPPPKVVKKATPAKGAKVNAKNGKAAKKAESEDEEDDAESEEEAPPPKKNPAKAAAKLAPAAAEESDDDDEDDDDEESEDEPPPPKKATKSAAKAPAKQVKAKPAKEPSDDEEDDEEEDESEEEAPPPKKAANQVAKSKAKKAKQEEEEDDEDESEEEMDTTPAPAVAKAKKAGMVKAKEESEEEDDDDEEEEDDEEDDDEDEEDDDEEAPVTPAKRKADGKKDTPPAKKAKSEDGFCLFIGNLNSNKDFDEIKNAARKFFTKNDIEVADVRLGASKKFGYVEFSCEEDMQKALELNGKKLMGQEIKLDKARSKENSQDCKKERDSRTIFVKNLPFSATVDDLKEVFEDAVDVRLPIGQNGSNRGIAYIEFKSEAEAEKMLEEAQGSDVQGRSIMLDFVGEKSQKGATVTAAAASKTLVVNNLAFSATEEALQSTFEKAVSIRIPQRDGRPKGFAFLEFDSAEDAKEALDTLNNTEIEGRSIRLEFSQNSGGRQEGGRGNSGPTKTLFVKGLSEETTDQTLKDAFDGSVGARIVTDRDTGSSKGFGFVDFDNEDDCKAAKEAMEDGEIDGSKVTLDYAKPKGEGGFRGGRGGGGFGGFGGRGGGGFGGRGGGGRGGRGGFGGRGGGGFGGRGGGGFGGRGRGGPRGGGRGGFGGGRGGGGFGAKPQGKKITFDD